TRSEGPPLRLRDRHRGHPRGLSRVGRGLRPPLRRHVGVRDLGLARAPPPLLTRPFWGQAVLLPPRRRPPRLRERAARVPPRPARAEPDRHPRLPRAELPRPHRRDLLRRDPEPAAGSQPHLRREGTPSQPLLAPRARRATGRPCRSRPRRLPRRDPPAPPQRRPRRNLPLRRNRLVGDRRRRRVRRGRAPEDGHGLFRRPRLRRAAVRPRGRERTGAEPHWVSFDADSLIENLPAIVGAQGEPFGSTSMAAQWYVMREAQRAGLKVMLDGQ